MALSHRRSRPVAQPEKWMAPSQFRRGASEEWMAPFAPEWMAPFAPAVRSTQPHSSLHPAAKPLRPSGWPLRERFEERARGASEEWMAPFAPNSTPNTPRSKTVKSLWTMYTESPDGSVGTADNKRPGECRTHRTLDVDGPQCLRDNRRCFFQVV